MNNNKNNNNNNNNIRFTRCARLNTIIKMLRTELYTIMVFNNRWDGAI